MFNFSQSQTFTYPVTVETLNDGGRVTKQTFNAVFKRLNTTEVTNWQSRIAEASAQGQQALTDTARELALDVVDGWSDVRESTGDLIPFSTPMLNSMLDIHPVPFSIASAWIEAVNGGAKRKN
jgi:hypothetical protein